VKALAQQIGVAGACEVLKVPRSRFYRHVKTGCIGRKKPSHALSLAEQERIRAILNSERFMDQSPRQVYATLLDEGVYLCHWRTMYRILSQHGEVRERRLLRRHPVYKKPELLANAPNQVWSWDITNLRGRFAHDRQTLEPIVGADGH
jgi:putative transposase